MPRTAVYRLSTCLCRLKMPRYRFLIVAALGVAWIVLVLVTLPPASQDMRISGDLAEIGNAVSFFDAAAYKAYALKEIVMKIKTDPPFSVCVQENPDDIVSSYARKGTVWESELVSHFQSELANARVDPTSFLSKSTGVVFVDVGVNIGTHALNFAAQGYRVLGVDAQRGNAARTYCGALYSGLLDRVTVVHNAVGDKLGNLTLSVPSNNNGGAIISGPDSGNKDWPTEQCPIVFLSDVVRGLSHMVMKIDIEGSECNAMLGSRDIFNRSASSYVIPAIFVEWHMAYQHVRESGLCSSEKERELKSMLFDNGYVPYHLTSMKLMRQNEAWPVANILWRYERKV